MAARLDTSIRPICFGIDPMVTKETAAAVGPEKFKKYEYILYLMAQLSRIVYCDTGIMNKVIQTSLGMSNDIVNKVISAYDSKFSKEKRMPISSQQGRDNRPMESYALGPAGTGDKYGTYISSPEDMTCVIVKASAVKQNPNSILTSTDIIISFKGSSTMDNFKHDLMSQFTASDLGKLIQGTGIKVEGEQNNVTGAFINPLVNVWTTLIQGISEFVTDDSRLFLTGHSLGGAYASLFTFILAEGKVSNTLPFMNKVKSIHLISFGAPCILGDNARNTFNRHLDSGLITLDRVVSQRVAARSAATQVLLGGIAGPNDVIPTIPAGFSHPGYRPLNNPLKNIYPEARGRPYSIDNIRIFYGVPTKTRYREATTWPFPEPVGLGDRSMSNELKSKVTSLTGTSDIPEEIPINPEVLKGVQVKTNGGEDPQSGGASSMAKAIYEKATLERIPNFVSVQGSAYSLGFAHAEYLGMFFLGGFRQPGMKNPGFQNNVAKFDLYNNSVTINYVDFKPTLELNIIKEVAEPVSANEDPKNPVAMNTPLKGGRRYRHRTQKKSRKLKKYSKKSRKV